MSKHAAGRDESDEASASGPGPQAVGAPLLVLIHSPLVGPLTWQACAAVLRSYGRPALVPTLAGVTDAEPPWIPKLAGRVAEMLRGARAQRGVVFIVHSAAGSLMPAVTRAVDAPPRAALFVDAVLPRPGRTWFETAPPALGDRLRELGAGGWLPPWDQWFQRDAIAAHLPEEDLRGRFVAELPRLPLAYFEERAPEAEGWDSIPCGYVQLSDAYEEAAREAATRGWPTVREHLDHLAMITRPEEVASILDRILEGIGIPRLLSG